jgi:hypothetical protein
VATTTYETKTHKIYTHAAATDKETEQKKEEYRTTHNTFKIYFNRRPTFKNKRLDLHDLRTMKILEYSVEMYTNHHIYLMMAPRDRNMS